MEKAREMAQEEILRECEFSDQIANAQDVEDLDFEVFEIAKFDSFDYNKWAFDQQASLEEQHKESQEEAERRQLAFLQEKYKDKKP